MTRQRKSRPKQGIAPQSDTPKKRDEGPNHGPSSRVVAQYREESSNTAIPPPSMLAAYNNAVPDAAERILRMAEEQQEHRHRLEAIVIRGDVRRADHGLYIGGAIIALAVICGSILVYFDKDVQGLLLGIGSMVTAVGAFIWGWNKRKHEVDRLRSLPAQRQDQDD